MTLCLAVVLGLGQEEFTVAAPTMDAEGVVHHRVTSSVQTKPVEVRILAPSKLPEGKGRRFLFVLPVEPEGQSRWGDGLAEARRLGIHDKYGLIVVAPGFAQLPWYADHPTDPKRRDETYFIRVVLPLVDRLYPSERPCRLLLGFSKSGWGAFSLILRHPDLFRAAAAWDAPLLKDKPDQFEMAPAFGSQEHFEGYHVARLLREKADLFRASRRLAHFGYGMFRDHHRRAQALLEELRIPAEYADGPARKHAWDSGWLGDAVAALDAMR